MACLVSVPLPLCCDGLLQLAPTAPGQHAPLCCTIATVALGPTPAAASAAFCSRAGRSGAAGSHHPSGDCSCHGLHRCVLCCGSPGDSAPSQEQSERMAWPLPLLLLLWPSLLCCPLAWRSQCRHRPKPLAGPHRHRPCQAQRPAGGDAGGCGAVPAGGGAIEQHLGARQVPVWGTFNRVPKWLMYVPPHILLQKLFCCLHCRRCR